MTSKVNSISTAGKQVFAEIQGKEKSDIEMRTKTAASKEFLNKDAQSKGYDYTPIIQDHDFKLAITYLKILTKESDEKISAQEIHNLKFHEKYGKQSQIIIALKILNTAAEEGSPEQKKALLSKINQIEKLNKRLLDLEGFAKQIAADKTATLGEVLQLQDFRVAKPLTDSEKALINRTRTARKVLSVLNDLSVLPLAGVTNLMGLCMDFNPKKPIRSEISVLLLPGAGYNDTEFALLRQFLGPNVYSVDYFGPGPFEMTELGVSGSATCEKVRNLIARIKKETGNSQLIVIGHSMGGNIGCEMSRVARKNPQIFDGVQIPWVITISSPLRGTPLLKGCKPTAKHREMDPDNPFCKDLYDSTLQAERNGELEIYNIGSTMDFLCPGRCTMLTEDPRRKSLFFTHGHLTPMASLPEIWQVKSWVQFIRERNKLKK